MTITLTYFQAVQNFVKCIFMNLSYFSDILRQTTVIITSFSFFIIAITQYKMALRITPNVPLEKKYIILPCMVATVSVVAWLGVQFNWMEIRTDGCLQSSSRNGIHKLVNRVFLSVSTGFTGITHLCIYIALFIQLRKRRSSSARGRSLVTKAEYNILLNMAALVVAWLPVAGLAIAFPLEVMTNEVHLINSAFLALNLLFGFRTTVFAWITRCKKSQTSRLTLVSPMSLQRNIREFDSSPYKENVSHGISNVASLDQDVRETPIFTVSACSGDAKQDSSADNVGRALSSSTICTVENIARRSLVHSYHDESDCGQSDLFPARHSFRSMADSVGLCDSPCQPFRASLPSQREPFSSPSLSRAWDTRFVSKSSQEEHVPNARKFSGISILNAKDLHISFDSNKISKRDGPYQTFESRRKNGTAMNLFNANRLNGRTSICNSSWEDISQHPHYVC